MSKQRMSVETIAEVLVNEFAKMEKQTTRYEKATAELSGRTEQLLNHRMKVDTEELKKIKDSLSDLLQSHTNKLANSVILSQNAYYALLLLVVLLSAYTAISLFLFFS